MPGALTQALAEAFDRVDDFVTVQSPLSADDLGPVLCLWESVGVSEDERAILGERITRLASSDQAGGLALGVLIGLFATQLSTA